jgi:LacI family transcriptional regulator
MKRDRPSLLLDVARVAGVSLATASRALSDPELVHVDTRKRVHDAVAKLGYVPHGAARALATKRSKTVGVVIPTLDNPIFASSIQAMQKRLAHDGYTLLLGSHEYDLGTEARVVSALVERGVDGLVLVGADHDPAVYAVLDKAGLPYELTWTRRTSVSPLLGVFQQSSGSASCAPSAGAWPSALLHDFWIHRE